MNDREPLRPAAGRRGGARRLAAALPRPARVLPLPATSRPACGWSRRSARPPRRWTTTPTSTCATARLRVRLASHDVARGHRARRRGWPAGSPSSPPRRRVAGRPRGASRCWSSRSTPRDHAAVKPFWRAVLGLADSPTYDQELVDPDGVAADAVVPADRAPHDEPRQRFHVDIRVPPEVAPGRVEAALGAGGTLVSDERAPTFWVLADAEGNKACVTTWQGRDGPGLTGPPAAVPAGSSASDGDTVVADTWRGVRSPRSTASPSTALARCCSTVQRSGSCVTTPPSIGAGTTPNEAETGLFAPGPRPAIGRC